MPTYSFRCSNPTCGLAFEQTKPNHLYADRAFCPQCNSLAERDIVTDAKSLQLWGLKPRQVDYQPHPDKLHIHTPSCGCAMTQDWHAKLATIEAKEALER